MTDTPPVDAPPVDAPPVDAPPVDAPPVDAPPIDAPQAPEWMANLPDELKSDATLSRFKDVEALGRGFIETQKVARSKVIVPGADATDEQRQTFFDAIGRPASIDDYDVSPITLPVDATDEQRAQLAEATKPYRELAHQIGLTNDQAKALAAFDQQRADDFRAKGKAEVDDLQAKLGRDYEPKRAAAQKIFAQIFGDPNESAEALDMAEEFDRSVGSGKFLAGMMRLAEKAGEHPLHDSDTVEGLGDVKDANARLTELQGNKEWRDRIKNGDPTTTKQRDHLLELAQRQAQRRSA